MNHQRIIKPPGQQYITLLSGGLDSTVLAFWLKSQGYGVKALSVNYGQRHKRELRAAMHVVDELDIEYLKLDLHASLQLLFENSTSSLVSNNPIPEGHYAHESMKATIVPNRNMILISLAAAWSVASQYDGVCYAAHSGDHAIYPDCRPEFLTALGVAVVLGSADDRIQKLIGPFIHITKAEIVSLGSALKVPFELTWSCYNGREKHCGKCGTCVERREAFQLAGVKDPTEYE